MISLTGITKIYTVGNQRVAALNGVDLQIEDGEFLLGQSLSNTPFLLSV